jgi:hypothetical protein
VVDFVFANLVTRGGGSPMSIYSRANLVLVHFFSNHLTFSPLKQMSRFPVPNIIANGKTALKPAHPGHEVRPRRLHQPMVMIAHQDIGMNSPAGSLADLRQRFQETRAIRIVLKDIFPPVATTQHVVNRTLELYPHFPRHGLSP